VTDTGLQALKSPRIKPARDKTILTDTQAETLRIFRLNPTVKAVAEIRKLAESTVATHLAEAIIAGHADDRTPQDFLTESDITELREVFAHAENIDRLSTTSSARFMCGGRCERASPPADYSSGFGKVKYPCVKGHSTLVPSATPLKSSIKLEFHSPFS
jgi:hypothetical protein